MKVQVIYDDTLYQLVPKEPTDKMAQAAHHLDLSYMPGQEGADRAAIYRAMLSAAPTPPAQPAEQTKSVAQWKSGNEFLPFHPQASHVNPDYRDGWNACYQAAQPAERKPFDEDEQYTIDRAADLLEDYAQWIRGSLANLEDHPYLPEIDMIVNDLRGIKP